MVPLLLSLISQPEPRVPAKRAPAKFSLVFVLDTANNILVDVYSASSSPDKSRQLKANCVEIAVLWKRHEKIKSYQISDLAYPPGVQAGTLETVTLASEIANAFSLANEIHTAR